MRSPSAPRVNAHALINHIRRRRQRRRKGRRQRLLSCRRFTREALRRTDACGQVEVKRADRIAEWTFARPSWLQTGVHHCCDQPWCSRSRLAGEHLFAHMAAEKVSEVRVWVKARGARSTHIAAERLDRRLLRRAGHARGIEGRAASTRGTSSQNGTM